MIPIGLQLWSLHEDCARDFVATVAAVGKMGYAGVELAGYGNLHAKGVAEATRRAGLEIIGMHVRLETLAAGFHGIIDDALALGTRRVVCSWWPPSHFCSASACEEIGERLNGYGAILRAHGLEFSYHNHDGEMKSVDGQLALDWLLNAAEPRNLAAEVDVYWANFAGISPSRLLKDLGRRCRLVHLKDSYELGSGPVDFREVFAAIDSVGAAEWLIVESDQHRGSPLDGVRLSLEQLKAWHRA
ncbi:MAG: xylose isomerase [Verrucomicrobia bacterium]|nr:xylose isomerase [Verrucomicrobiota bacterium]